MRHIAVVGGSLAGVSAIEGLREFGFGGDITLIEAEPNLPYDKPPLSKGALADGEAYAKSLLLHERGWYDERGITLRLGRRVTGLDPAQKSLHTDAGAAVRYDGLVIATGSAARDLPVPCSEPARVHRLRTLADSVRLRGDLVPGRHLVVVGGGFIGLEVAATARGRGLDVTVVESAATPLGRVFGPELGHWFRQLHERHGVDVRCAAGLQEISTDRMGLRLRFAEGQSLRADVVVAGVGAAPQTGWLAGSGVAVSDGIRCTSDLRTSAPAVVAAGDVAHWHNSLFAADMRVEHWTNAVEQGRHAARTLLGERDDYRAVPYFWTDQYDAKVRFVGRAGPDHEVLIEEPRPGKLVAIFGRDGVLRGALSVNAPRRLAAYREAIGNRMSWNEAVGRFARDGRTPLIPSAPGAAGRNTRSTT